LRFLFWVTGKCFRVRFFRGCHFIHQRYFLHFCNSRVGILIRSTRTFAMRADHSMIGNPERIKPDSHCFYHLALSPFRWMESRILLSHSSFKDNDQSCRLIASVAITDWSSLIYLAYRDGKSQHMGNINFRAESAWKSDHMWSPYQWWESWSTISASVGEIWNPQWLRWWFT
jgi:hypothetical protein